MTHFFIRGANHSLAQHRRYGIQSFRYNTNGHGEALTYNGLSGLSGSSVRVCLVVLNQRSCGSSQNNLPNRMFRLGFSTILNQSYVLFITLVNITCQSEDQYLPSIHSWDSGP